MEQLLESLDEAIFTPELKGQINELFESKIQAIKEEYEAKTAEVEAKIEEAIAAEKEKAEAYAEYVKEALEAKTVEYTDYVKEELENTLSAYMDKVVEEFIDQNRITIEESVENAKLRALLEGFDSMLKTGSVYLSDVVEAKTESGTAKELSAVKEELSKVIKENADLKAEKENLVKESIYTEITEGMTIVEKEKFSRLTKFVKFNESDVESYKDSLISFKEEVLKKVEESAKPEGDTVITESVTEKKSYSDFI